MLIPGRGFLKLLLVVGFAVMDAVCAAGDPPDLLIQRLLDAGKPQEALRQIAALDPETRALPLVDHLAGIAHYQQGSYREAVSHLQRSFEASHAGSPQRLQAAHLLGMSHYLAGAMAEAIPYLEALSGSSLDNSETQYMRGISYLHTHRYQDSRLAFSRMFSVPPDSAAACLLNAQMMIRRNHEDAAEKELKEALKLDPKLPQAHFLLGELAIYRGDIEAGIELLKAEIELNPGFAMSYYRLGEALTRQMNWDDSIAPLQKSIWLNPFFSGPFIVLGKVYLKKGDLSNAENILRRALSMDANNYAGHHLLGQVLQRLGRIEEAREEFQVAERLRPSARD
jgi:tetratricopeptide (TPR) repeat protein